MVRGLSGYLYPIVIATLIFAYGCEREPSKTTFTLSRFPQQRSTTTSDQRDALRVSLRGPATLALGQTPAGSVLRVGVLPLDSEDGVVTLRIVAGDSHLKTIRIREPNEWHDTVLPLDSETGRVLVEFDAKRPFMLAPCEVYSDQTNRPDVFIYRMDTVRQDRLSCYGYDREISPHLEAFARVAVRFTQLVPSSSWTRPSVATLLTGTQPNLHGCKDRSDVMRGDVPTLARPLGQAGYETNGLIANPNCLPTWGFGSNFFRYVDVDADMLDALDALGYGD